jgi:uracil-DNA glycosylase
MSLLDEQPFAPVPDKPSLKSLRGAVGQCHTCELSAHATQPVIGECRRGARLMLVSEQPGDQEDIEGHPSVGPAGKVLDEGLERAGIDRRDAYVRDAYVRDAYVTNVMKHFRSHFGSVATVENPSSPTSPNWSP